MQTKKVKIESEFITLGQLLKFARIIGNGSEAKLYLASNEVTVNGEIENRRGRKLYPGYVVSVPEATIEIEG